MFDIVSVLIYVLSVIGVGVRLKRSHPDPLESNRLPGILRFKYCRKNKYHQKELHMRKWTTTIPAVLTVFLVLFISTTVFSAGNATEQQPIAFFPEKSFVFDEVLDGVEVTHEYIVQNKGTGVLKIERVRTG